MDIRKIKKLIELLDESGIAEIEIKEGEESLRISRNSPHVAAPAMMAAPMVTAPAPLAPAPVESNEPDAKAIPEGHIVKSPMVGTFYRAPSPATPCVY